MEVSFRPLTGSIGAEVLGFDASAESDPGAFDRIREAWLDRGVLVFPGQELSVEAQMGFASRWGDLAPLAGAQEGAPVEDRFVMNVTNVKLEGKKSYLPDGEMYFHFDTAFLDRPYSACFLYGIEVTSRGGHTLFASATAAYDALPADLKATVDDLEAVNAFDYRNPSPTGTSEISPDAPRAVHPVVIRHPDTGRKALFVNRLMTQSIVGMAEARSADLLEELFAHVERPEFVYEHAWREKDLVVWDNRCVLHARSDFSPDERRRLRRVSVQGDRPSAHSA